MPWTLCIISLLLAIVNGLAREGILTYLQSPSLKLPIIEECEGSPRPVKKRKFDLPLEESYTLNPISVQNAVSTTLTLPTETQHQQQAYILVHQELLTVDNSQLYGLVPSASSTCGRLPNVESWAIYSTPPAACPDPQTIMHTSVPQDGCSVVQVGEIPLAVTPIKMDDCKEEAQTNADTRKNIPEKLVQTSVSSTFPMQFVNVNGNVHIPITVQAGGRTYAPIKYWDPQTLQPQLLQQPVPEQPVPVQMDWDLPSSSLKPEEGAHVWKVWAQVKNEELLKEAGNRPAGPGRRKPMQFREDVLSVSIAELNYGLCLMTKEARKSDGSPFEADTLYYLFLCIQKYMFDNDRIDNVFADLYYSKFLEKLHDMLKNWVPTVSPLGYVIPY
ncbi:transcriptional regulator QRICH1-like [Protopterus annectens]|uniref:transcriptional regulator QRICH1-like n=1 Tax=Protopterus annectens TaxID=7888 RepID=UPI001CF98435|nr:transcriptional regulator QRICH1-like [Protopterus annectens]